ncbi:hypothetical protein H4R99_002346 [Coemansia sp. RSA 1722]|nr:hypothetical protein IWW45_002398 [Coemansia sp. RSA 485]KAJ2603488.1 hypothetical protein H4R99_002346 [Coemansia sp. RSA 1722]
MASVTKVAYESSSSLINMTSQLGQPNSSYVNEPASSLLTDWCFDTNPSFNNCFLPTSNNLTTLVQQTTLGNLPTLVNKPPDLDIEEYFNNKNSILYDKKTKKLKGKAPNAFMIYRLSQIKDLKGKRHTPEFINNVISNGWAKLLQEERAHYLWLSRALQRRLDQTYNQGRTTAGLGKKHSKIKRKHVTEEIDNKGTGIIEAEMPSGNVVYEVGFTGKLCPRFIFPENKQLVSDSAETKTCQPFTTGCIA